MVTIYGSSLDSVAAPEITLTVVITRFDSDMNVTSSVIYPTSEVMTLCIVM